MKKLLGGPGTKTGLLLRIGQCVFASASIGAMISASGFSNFSPFCYLISSMGLQLLWSLGVASLDAIALKTHTSPPYAVVGLFAIGDWVTATLTLAGACASAGVMVLYTRDIKMCRIEPQMACSRFQISIAFAFITWLLIALSSLIMFWMLGSA